MLHIKVHVISLRVVYHDAASKTSANSNFEFHPYCREAVGDLKLSTIILSELPVNDACPP
jgi:hypothetical protein